MTTNATAGNAETLMRSAVAGRLPKLALASLLEPAARREFLDACATIEKRFTHACATSGDPCLESGCSCDGEACLQPLLRAGSEYLSACGAEWVKWFAIEGNRDVAWTTSEYMASDFDRHSMACSHSSVRRR